MKIQLNNQMQLVRDFFQPMGGEIYFIGGCVRDILMAREPNDYDLATNLLPEVVEAYVESKGRHPWVVGKRFGSIGVAIPDKRTHMTEVTTFRSELYDFQTRKPVVRFANDLKTDIGRRDFTINAMAADFEGNIIDHFGGQEDLKNKVLRAVGKPTERFQEDPLRILRAIRMSSKYALTIEPKTSASLLSCRWELLRLSRERITEEITKMLLLPPSACRLALERLWEYQIFQVIFPEMQLQYNYDQNSPYHEYVLHEHTIRVVLAVQVDSWEPQRLWAALLHDVAKPFVQTLHKSGERCNYINHELLGAEIANRWLTDYKFGNDQRKFIVTSIRDHLKNDCWLRPYDNASKRSIPKVDEWEDQKQMKVPATE